MASLTVKKGNIDWSSMALVKGHLRIVKSSLLGSILANLLLVLGMSFLIGGLHYREQLYNNTATQMSACLMSLAVLSLLIPLKSHTYMYKSTPQHVVDEESHPGVFGKEIPSRRIKRRRPQALLGRRRTKLPDIPLSVINNDPAEIPEQTANDVASNSQQFWSYSGPSSRNQRTGIGISRHAQPPSRRTSHTSSRLQAERQPETEVGMPPIGRFSSILLLSASTALVATCARFMVDSLEDLVKKTPLGELFVGLIILPLVGNAAEHFTAITVASKNKMDLAIGIAIGSSIQIALFVTPVVVLIGWIAKIELTLHFHLFESTVLFLAAFVVNFLVLDGRSNYLEGSLLCAAYVLIASVDALNPIKSKY
ncbi:MAG: hypothetical protein Q9167_002241 [Letrouitia subvulpina]